jgi:glyoxylase-like metal-dependent hydrolase (beta-lactamase superfamily II)
MSDPIKEVDEENDSGMDPSLVVYLKRGGVQVTTAIGTIQFGMPPETIKDSMLLGVPIPKIFVVPPERFNRRLGPNEGINIAEFEFPAYAAFFFTGGNAKVKLIVSNAEVEERIRVVMQETLLGPIDIDIESDFADHYPRENMPDLRKELDYFGVFMGKKLTVDGLLDFNQFSDDGWTTITGKPTEEGGAIPEVKIHHANGEYMLYEGDKMIAVVDENIKLPIPDNLPRFTNSFRPPLFGVTVLGNSHGFNPGGRTSGYVVWVNRRGIMVDPPPHSTSILQQQCIPPSLIDGVIISHCHADHDAGTFQKILREGRVTLMTTPTIMYSFLRKYAALSGLDLEFLRGVFHYRAVSIGQPIKIRGGRFEFFYTLHSIPCIGFSVHFGGKSMVFSADHMNDPVAINKLYAQGVVSTGRRDVLLNFPWDHDVILHEAGIPPIHTPMDTLVALPEEIKKKLWVVHSDAGKIPEGSNLRLAKEGVQNTLSLNVDRPKYSDVRFLFFVFCLNCCCESGLLCVGCN